MAVKEQNTGYITEYTLPRNNLCNAMRIRATYKFTDTRTGIQTYTYQQPTKIKHMITANSALTLAIYAEEARNLCCYCLYLGVNTPVQSDADLHGVSSGIYSRF